MQDDKFTYTDDVLPQQQIVEVPGDRQVVVSWGAKGRLHVEVRESGRVLNQMIVPIGKES